MFAKLDITGFTLKVLAIIGMTCNHVAHAFMPLMPHWVTFVLYSLGGITYPIMAFILVEGYLHTSNLKKYATRLAIFAVISQIPFTLLNGWTANVLVTLLMALGLLWAYDNIRPRSTPLFLLILVAIEVISYFCDWAIAGPLIALGFYVFRKRGAAGISLTMLIPYICYGVPALIYLIAEIAAAITNTPDIVANNTAEYIARAYVNLHITGEPLLLSISGFAQMCALGYALIGFSLAWFCLLFYKGTRGRSMKWFFYAYYPLHLFVIWVLKELLR